MAECRTRIRRWTVVTGQERTLLANSSYGLMTRAALSCGSTGNYDKGHRMAIVESLLSTAYEDTQLLTELDQDGDRFSIARDVDFVLKTEEFNPTCAVLRIALMMCLAQVFSLDYDGWGCVVRRQADQLE
jgi:hypothetical protein